MVIKGVLESSCGAIDGTMSTGAGIFCLWTLFLVWIEFHRSVGSMVSTWVPSMCDRGIGFPFPSNQTGPSEESMIKFMIVLGSFNLLEVHWVYYLEVYAKIYPNRIIQTLLCFQSIWLANQIEQNLKWLTTFLAWDKPLSIWLSPNFYWLTCKK